MGKRCIRPAAWFIAIALLGGCRRGARSDDRGSAKAAGGTSPVSEAMSMAAEPIPLARLERTACAGTCPAYQIEVWSDGTVRYDGGAYVKVKGAAESRLSPAELARVRAAFEETQFTTLQPTPFAVIDLSTTTLAYRDGERMHVLQFLHPSPNMQRLITELETIVGAINWVGTDTERLPPADSAPPPRRK